MDKIEAIQEYTKAMRMAQKEYKERIQLGKEPYPEVLDVLLPEADSMTSVEIGVIEIPTERIVGTKTAGRISAFTAGFLPLLGVDTEFAYKWVSLCAAHLSDEGIREPIKCYEYLGNFYILEGNKRVSVLKYFGAPRIPGQVIRLLPPVSDEPRIKAYYEFLDFYKSTGIYDIQFHHSGDYAKLLSYLGKDAEEEWTQQERQSFRAGYSYFREAYGSLKTRQIDLLPEEALLLWLHVYPFRDLRQLSRSKLEKALEGLYQDMLTLEQPVQVETQPDTEAKGGILGILRPVAEHLQIAFIHQMAPAKSTWERGHEDGVRHLKRVLQDRVTVRSYYHADTQQQAEQLLEQAVEEGAQVVFTTTPKLSRPTLKAAVKHPKVKFLNCSVDAPYSSMRTYYSRIFEGKFITGAIAGAMSEDDRIGYVGDYPIFGVPASINAFALGAQLTNPRAKIMLRWSCLDGDPMGEFLSEKLQIISNRDISTADGKLRSFGSYGTYLVDENNAFRPLGSPCWNWGKFYEHVVQSILNGAWDRNKDSHHAVNYWWGIDSGVIDVELSENLPEGLKVLAGMLRKGLQKHTIDPFRRKIVAQDGSVKNTGDRTLTPEELLHMDWLCENVDGELPPFEKIKPVAWDMVRELGIYRDEIPLEKEGSL